MITHNYTYISYKCISWDLNITESFTLIKSKWTGNMAQRYNAYLPYIGLQGSTPSRGRGEQPMNILLWKSYEPFRAFLPSPKNGLFFNAFILFALILRKYFGLYKNK